MLNAYRAFAEAVRLKARGWPRNREALLRDSTISDFSSVQAGEEEFDAQALHLRGAGLVRRDDCESRQQGVALLHRALLLTAGDGGIDARRVFEDSRRLLVQQLTREGLTGNAAFFRSLSTEEAPGVLTDFLSGGALPTHTVRLTGGVIRSLAGLSDGGDEVLLALVTGANQDPAGNAALVAAQMRPPRLAILRAGLENRNPGVRARVVRSFAPLYREALPLLQQAARDADPDVRIEVATLAGHLGRSDRSGAQTILTALQRDGHAEVRAEAERQLREIAAWHKPTRR